MNSLIEIATTDYITTAAAVKGGADRIELCNAISEGGITPSFAFIKKCRESFSLPVFPIIRPRSGDFLYSEEEFEIMLNDALQCRELGCNGIVTGFLMPDGTVDKNRTAKLIEAVYPLEVTFHRAFDRCKDPFETVEQLAEIGCRRILTSGQQPKAEDALLLLKQLVEAAGEKIIIMPGSGLNADNIKRVASATGAREFHGALRNKRESEMEFRNTAFPPQDYINPWIAEEEVRAFKNALLTDNKG